MRIKKVFLITLLTLAGCAQTPGPVPVASAEPAPADQQLVDGVDGTLVENDPVLKVAETPVAEAEDFIDPLIVVGDAPAAGACPECKCPEYIPTACPPAPECSEVTKTAETESEEEEDWDIDEDGIPDLGTEKDIEETFSGSADAHLMYCLRSIGPQSDLEKALFDSLGPSQAAYERYRVVIPVYRRCRELFSNYAKLKPEERREKLSKFRVTVSEATIAEASRILYLAYANALFDLVVAEIYPAPLIEEGTYRHDLAIDFLSFIKVYGIKPQQVRKGLDGEKIAPYYKKGVREIFEAWTPRKNEDSLASTNMHTSLCIEVKEGRSGLTDDEIKMIECVD